MKLPQAPGFTSGTGAPDGIRNVLEACAQYIMLAAARPDAVEVLKAQPWFDRLLIEADPYRFPKQHVELIETFGPEVNLANIPLGQAPAGAQDIDTR
jgi:phosphosulfolactate synthase